MKYMQDPNSKEPSPTLTLLWVGVMVALTKLLVADADLLGVKWGSFTGADFALVVAPFLANYGHKRHTNKSKAVVESKEQKGE